MKTVTAKPIVWLDRAANGSIENIILSERIASEFRQTGHKLEPLYTAPASDVLEALTLAANRLARCVVDCVPNSREWFERSEWADEAQAAAAKAVSKARAAS